MRRNSIVESRRRCVLGINGITLYVCFARYPVTWLDSATTLEPLYHNPATVSRVYWDSSLSLDNIPAVDYAQLLEQERLSAGKAEQFGDGLQRPALKRLLINLLTYGFAFIDNTPQNIDATMEATGIVSFPQVYEEARPT